MIRFRAIVEVLGKPKEHIEASLRKYIEKLKEDKNYTVHSVDFAEAQEKKEEGLWAAFAEVELSTEKVINMVNFSLDYMPSLLEVISPQQLTLRDVELSTFLNDLQAKLHAVDMIAKQLKVENDVLARNTGNLLKNYITVLLGKQSLTSEQISRLTGVLQDRLEDFLDQLIDEQRVDLKAGVYSLKQKKEE